MTAASPFQLQSPFFSIHKQECLSHSTCLNSRGEQKLSFLRSHNHALSQSLLPEEEHSVSGQIRVTSKQGRYKLRNNLC